MDDIKTMYQKVKEIFTTEHHIDLDTDNMLTEELVCAFISVGKMAFGSLSVKMYL